MPYGVSSVFAPPELEAVAAEAAGLSLSEVVASAMDEADPFAPLTARCSRWPRLRPRRRRARPR
jgi:hypothetical protein